MSSFVTSYADWISFCGVVVTVLGFALTVWQLLSVKGKLHDVEIATKTRMENTLTLVGIVELLQVISAIHDNLQNEEWEKSISRMANLHVTLSGITPQKVVKENARNDFGRCVSQITSDLSILRNYKKSKPSQTQIQSMARNLDVMVENLKLIEQKLK